MVRDTPEDKPEAYWVELPSDLSERGFEEGEKSLYKLVFGREMDLFPAGVYNTS